MAIGNILSFFQPKDKIFFALFEQMTAKLVEMSSIFHQNMLEFDNNDEAQHQKMSDYEHEMDALTHQVFVELGKNFITPFDREDIHALASALDDIADYIFASSRNLFLYKAPEMKEYSELSLIINKQCQEINSAVKNLKGFKNMDLVKEACIKINSMENIADDIYGNGAVNLFKDEDPIRIIKAKAVLDFMEEVTDKAEDAANVIETIMIKYA